MKKIGITVVCILSLVIGSIFPFSEIFASGTPGSSNDPIVTKSYVDSKFQEILNLLNSSNQSQGTTYSGDISKEEIVNEVMAQISYYYGDSLLEPKLEGESFTPVFLSAEQVLVGDEGTEIVLRSGKAVAYVGVQNGLSNLTDGKELFNNDTVNINHLLVVPKKDARGIKATTDAWIIIKGSYEILN